jgi:O-antigen/teichoic acid export membrane protein
LKTLRNHGLEVGIISEKEGVEPLMSRFVTRKRIAHTVSLLWEEVAAGARRRIVKNIFSLASANSLAAGGVFLLNVLVARSFSREEFGQYSLAFAFVAAFAISSHLGLDILITRDVARDRSLAGKFLGAGLLLGFGLSLLALVLITGTVNLFGYSPSTKLMVVVVTIALVATAPSLLCRAIFRAFERMEMELLVVLISTFLLVAVGVLAIALGGSVVVVVAAYPVAGLAAFVAAFALVRAFFAKPLFAWNPQLFRYLLVTTIPFTLNGLLLPIYSRVDTIVLGTLKGADKVGLYSAAYTVVAPLWILGPSVARAVFPSLAVASTSHVHSYRLYLLRTLQVTSVLLSLFVLVVTVLAARILTTVFGPAYGEASGALRILVLAGSLAFLNGMLLNALEASNRQMRATVMLAIGAGISFLLSLSLIPVLSYRGAALASLIAQGVVFFVTLRFTGVLSAGRMGTEVMAVGCDDKEVRPV